MEYQKNSRFTVMQGNSNQLDTNIILTKHGKPTMNERFGHTTASPSKHFFSLSIISCIFEALKEGWLKIIFSGLIFQM